MGIVKYKESAKDTIYHLFNRGNQKRKIFFEEQDYILYLAFLHKACQKLQFNLFAYCLMSNHIHLIIKQMDEKSPDRLIASVHTSYVKTINKKYKLVGHLFQGPFRQKIIDSDSYLQTAMDYVHFNPVKDGLCKSVKEYPWSSYNELNKPNQSICVKLAQIDYRLGTISPQRASAIMQITSQNDRIDF